MRKIGTHFYWHDGFIEAIVQLRWVKDGIDCLGFHGFSEQTKKGQDRSL
jgi:hypothetical protein